MNSFTSVNVQGLGATMIERAYPSSLAGEKSRPGGAQGPYGSNLGLVPRRIRRRATFRRLAPGRQAGDVLACTHAWGVPVARASGRARVCAPRAAKRQWSLEIDIIRGIIVRVHAGLIGLVLLAGCGSQLVEGRDYWIDQQARTIYTRSEQIAQNVCMMRGADYGPYLARNVLTGVALGSGVSTNTDSWNNDAFGCYDARDDVIICTKDNPACMPHEQGHRGGILQHD